MSPKVEIVPMRLPATGFYRKATWPCGKEIVWSLDAEFRYVDCVKIFVPGK